MRRVFLGFLIIFLLPTSVFASCTNVGYTVILVNGILTNEADAHDETNALQRMFGKYSNLRGVAFRTGYNPSHLGGGLGDLTQSIFQAFDASISDYDLHTMLRQLQPQVTTRKLLLVGHSQGTFYTNEMYGYLTTHGVPKESIAVYNIATPASYISGGGGYITSANDKVINLVRDAEASGNLSIHLNSYYTVNKNVVASALRANYTIPKEPKWDTDDYGGHHFSVYLNGATDRIVSDIERELRNLKATGGSAEGACFESPDETLADNVQKTLLAVADPVATGVHDLADGASGAIASTLGRTLGGLAGGFSKIFGATGSQNLSQAVAAAIPVSNIEQTPAKPLAVVSSPRIEAPQPAPSAGEHSTRTPPNDPSPKQPPLEQSTAPVSKPVPLQATPGFGGGGTAAQNSSVQANALMLSILSPGDGSYSATSSLLFSGTTAANALITAIFSSYSTSTTADNAGNWSLTLQLPEGSDSVTTIAKSGGSTASDTRVVNVDLTAPGTTTVSVADCAASLSAGSCLLPLASTAVSWSSVANAASYALATNGVASATSTATAATGVLISGATTTFAVVSYDLAGNAATSSELEVAAVSKPLIINEVGWGGTDTDPTNQWIEVKNLSSRMLDLSHVSVVRSGGSAITLSGTLPATTDKYLIVAPGNPNFFGAHYLTTAFSALATTTAEQLSLVWNNAVTLDTTPPTAQCSTWCAGSYLATLGTNLGGHSDLRSPLSMERAFDTSDGSLSSSWHSTDSYGPWISGTSNPALWGTPGAENSAGLPGAGVYCGSKTNLLTSSASPGPSFSPGNTCVFLSRFVTGSTFGATRYGAVFRGDVASSTGAGLSMFKTLASEIAVNIQSQGPATGEHYFFAMWEDMFGNDTPVFNFYFTKGASSTQGISGPPHGNYVTIPFMYSP